MSTVPRRQQGLLISGALAVVGALVAGVILFTSGKASEVNLTSASLVPADAAVFVGLNTDLSSSQWVSAFKVVEKLGQENPEDELKRAVTDGAGLDWEKEIAPFLGGDAAFFLTGVDILGRDFAGGVIVRCKDSRKAMDVFLDQAGRDVTEHEYDGVAYSVSTDDDGAVARLDDHLVVTSDEETLKLVIDVWKGRKPSLGGDGEFKQLRDDLTGNFLAFAWVRMGSLFEGTPLDDAALREALERAGSKDLLNRPMGAAITASDGGLGFHAASRAEVANSQAWAIPRESRFAKLVPQDTVVFASTAGIADAWGQAMSSGGRNAIDDALEQDGTFGSLDDLFSELGRPLGLGSIEEVVQILSGEAAVALWPRDESFDDPEGVFLAEVRDEKQAAAILAKLFAANSSGRPRTESIGGHDVTIADTDTGEETAYAVLDGYVVAGTLAGVRTYFDSGKKDLTATAEFKHTRATLQSALGTFAYINLHRIFEGSMPGGFGPFEAASLEGAIFNFVTENGLSRTSGVVTVKE